MERSEAFDALRDAAVEVLSVDAGAVTEQASFADDLEADSLDLVELVMAVEDRLGVEIGEDDLGDVATVGDAVDLIVAAAAAKV
ncbi:MAG TPA: acyl carrier protein [Acidimicrobiales bacterium]|jgi:acyl carrier protein|nr:acyl carrier protein [Acidimicrobiales bacterium]